MAELNRSVERTLIILSELAKGESVGLRTLSRRTDISLGATERIINTLEAYNYVEWNDLGKLMLGRELFYLGKVVESNIGVHRIIMQEIRTLVEVIDETVYLVGRRGNHIVYIDGIQSSHPIQYFPKIGELYDMPYGASGKVFLASMEEEEAKHTLEYFNLEYERIIDELTSVKINGYATSKEERFKGLLGYSIPVTNKNGSFDYVLSVTIPSYRFNEEKKDFIIESVKNTANKISVIMDGKETSKANFS